MKTHRILELDGLRAFAVLLVVMHHIINWSGNYNVNPTTETIFLTLGEGGVHIFFVISGFIITSLLIREALAFGRVSLRGFYRRRFFRIIPPFAFYLLGLALLCQADYISIKPLSFLWSSLFLGNLGLLGEATTSDGWFLGHTWSLSVEEQYYLFFPPIMVTVLRFRPKLTTLLLLILFFICLLAYKLATEASQHIHLTLINIAVLYPFRYIIVGVLVALHITKVQKIVQNTSALLPTGIIAAILILPFINPQSSFIWLILDGLEAISYGFLVLWFVENPDRCPALRWGWVQWIGACSYSIYLWQQLFTGRSHFYNGWSIAQPSFAIIAIFICAALSYYIVEKPSIRFSRFLSSKS
ncbi:acyltransferase family protein [Hymenobacter sp. HD11105]